MKRYNSIHCFFLGSILAADTISSIDFNEDGEFLAAGDKGGRIVVFKRDVEVREINTRTNFPFSVLYNSAYYCGRRRREAEICWWHSVKLGVILMIWRKK